MFFFHLLIKRSFLEVIEIFHFRQRHEKQTEQLEHRAFWFWQMAFNILAVIAILILMAILIQCNS
jgi:hypothetical protein